MSETRRFEICNKRGILIVVIAGKNFKEALQQFIDEKPTLSLIGMDLSGREMSGMQLIDVNFFHADLRNTNLSNANCEGADFSYAIIDGNNFEGTNLTDTISLGEKIKKSKQSEP